MPTLTSTSTSTRTIVWPEILLPDVVLVQVKFVLLVFVVVVVVLVGGNVPIFRVAAVLGADRARGRFVVEFGVVALLLLLLGRLRWW